MSNIEENKRLITRYPFLIPRNVWTDKVADDYDYSYIRGDYELPNGWHKLFLQMCDDIRQPLIDAGELETFRFSQIKEKYNSIRCYHFGAPQEVEDIINKYEYISRYVCQECGNPAAWETKGWIASYCDKCLKDDKECCEPIEFDPIMRMTRWFPNGDKQKLEIDCDDIWRRLYA